MNMTASPPPTPPAPSAEIGLQLGHARDAGAADIDEIVRVTNSAYLAEAFCVHGPRTSAQDVQLQMSNGQFMVLDDPANPARLLASVMWSISGERGYLGMLAVDPAHQGQGLARILIQAVEQRCRASQCRFLELTVINLREELLRYYSGLGFVQNNTLPFPAPDRIKQPLHLLQMSKML
jgi:ribosomal protein S18 acetylase RimI-like enzyme